MTMENKQDVGISYTEELEKKVEMQKGIIKFLYLILEEMPSNKVQEVLAQLEIEHGEPTPFQETLEYIESEVIGKDENYN